MTEESHLDLALLSVTLIINLFQFPLVSSGAAGPEEPQVAR
jgi:hypothetical protein